MADPKPTPLPDHPPVPRPRRSAWLYALAALGLVINVGYWSLARADWEPGEPERNELDPTVRSSPGGYRSYHFWHSGYHGGK
ncbi:MAG: hypothetical protein NT062_17040 [Proteobacteria bacterium]|nr:hypothetical protein [Pseudomonadota bacterium]